MKLGFLLAGMALASSADAKTLIVKYRTDKALELTRTLESADIKVLDEHKAGRLLKVEVDETRESSILALFNSPNVEYAVEDFKLHAFGTPFSAEALKEQWAIKKVNAEAAWAKAGNRGSRQVIIGVIDTGVDSNHEALKPNMVQGYDFRDNDADPNDETSSANPGHGTHCAGIAGATGLIDGGIVGMSADVSIMPIRFLGSDGSGDLMGGIKSIDYAIEKKVDVISASWGATIAAAQAQPLIEAVKRASDAGIVFVSAAANDGRNNDSKEVYPANANFENTITVAASDLSDGKPSWSNFGKRTVDLAAPGLTIMSTLPGNKYDNLSGTSMATPLVSGMVAFLLAQDSSLTGAEVRSLLQTTGAKVSIETACDCRVDALAAVESLKAKKAYFVPAAQDLKTGDKLKVALKNADGYTFSSSDESVLKVSATGEVEGVKEGSAQIVAKKGSMTLTSLDYVVGAGGSTPPAPVCPFGEQWLCDLLCLLDPNQDFCQK
jgi:thermitase